MYQVGDIESSGLYCPLRQDVLTLCLIALNEKLEEIDMFYTNSRPKSLKYWDKGSEKIHGFSIDEAMSFKPYNEARDEFMHYLLKHKGKNHFVCHARPVRGKKLYDYFWLEQYVGDEYLYDFYSVIKPQHCRTTHVKNGPIKQQKLSDWATYLGIPLNHHEVKSDTKACVDIFKWQMHNKEKITFHNYEEIYSQSLRS